MSIRIPHYNSFIRNTRPIIIHPKKRKGIAQAGKPFTVPPLNAGIVLTKLKKAKPISKKKARAIPIPKNFDLRTQFPISVVGDRSDPNTSQYQQYSCGCCWAYSVATSMSDAFTVKYNFATNPKLSWTYMLACYPNENNPSSNFVSSLQCGGGDVPSLFMWLQENGAASSVCVDYSWCMNSSECVGQAGNPTDMNSQIPSCGCYNQGTFLKYKIKDVMRMNLDSTTDQSPDQISILQTQLKQHIMTNGSIVGCFHVLSNIVEKNQTTGRVGDFKTSKNEEGVYLECVGVRDSCSVAVPQTDNTQDQCTSDTSLTILGILGAHAVSITGWGVAPVHKSLIRQDILTLAPNVETSPSNSDMYMVPYWWVRNSWGITFAENGYFKMAMYPFNRISVLERSIQIKTTNGNILAGGCVIFTPDVIIRENYKANNQKGLEKNVSNTQNGDTDPNIGFFPGGKQGATSNSGSGGGVTYVSTSFLPNDDNIPNTKSMEQQSSTIPVLEEKKDVIKTFEEPINYQINQTSSSYKTTYIWIGVSVLLLFVVLCFYVLCIRKRKLWCPFKTWIDSHFPIKPIEFPVLTTTQVSKTQIPTTEIQEIFSYPIKQNLIQSFFRPH